MWKRSAKQIDQKIYKIVWKITKKSSVKEKQREMPDAQKK